MTDLKKMLLGVGSLSMAGSVTAQQAPASEKGEVPTPPNILFLVVDDLKPNIGPYGDPIARTPAFDRIAASGVTFMNNYCQFPLSGPTRASVLTGLRPDHTGVWTLDGIFRRNNPEIVSLPQLFAAHGYETVGIGKVYHPLSDETYNNDPVSWTKPYIKPQAPVYMLPEGKPVTECVDVPDNAYFDGRVADEAVAWIDSLSRSDKPFFLAVGFIRPHLPFVAPEKYWDLYDRDKMPLAEFQSMSSDPVPCAYHNSNEVKAYTDVPSFHSYMPGQELDAEIQRRLVHGYYACTSYTDAQIGRVLDALRKVGLDDNTIVVGRSWLSFGRSWLVEQTDEFRGSDTHAADDVRPRHDPGTAMPHDDRVRGYLSDRLRAGRYRTALLDRRHESGARAEKSPQAN